MMRVLLALLLVAVVGCGTTEQVGDAVTTDMASDTISFDTIDWGDSADALPECTDEEMMALRLLAEAVALEAEPCFFGVISWSTGEVILYPDTYTFCETVTNDEILEPMYENVLAALTTVEFDIGCTMNPSNMNIRCFGGAYDDLEMMEDLAIAHCPELWHVCEYGLSGFEIRIDAEGRVEQVLTRGGCYAGDETIACIVDALEGIVFPCMMSLSICPGPW